VVSSGGEHVYVGYQQSVVAIPCELSAENRPKSLFAPPQNTVFEEWIKTPQQSEGPVAARGPVVGGALSVSPEGMIFGAAGIHVEEQGSYEAVLALSGTDGSIVGWTGGQTQAAHPEGEGQYQCVIEPLFYSPATPVAAGSGGDVFVLAPAFLFDRPINNAHEIVAYGPAAPAVIELGPGGSGCPEGTSHEGLIARVKGEPIGEKAINTGESVNFSTHLLQADSLAVEWDFGDGSKETVSTLQLRQPEAHHSYTHGGSMTVTAVIHTDDLASPTITLTTHVKVGEAASTGPTALANGPLEAYVGLPALFDGSPSFDASGPNQVVTYHWDFGDGGQETTSEPVTFHTYTALGAYTAALTVTDKNGLTSAPYTLPQQVRVIPPPPPPFGGAGREGAGEEAPPLLARQGAGAGAGVASYHSTAAVIPAVTLAVASLRASRSGAVGLALYCPAAETTCAGTVTVRAALARAGSTKRHGKTTRVTIASGSFKLGGGTQKLVTLRLSSAARAFLARAAELHAQVLILAHDPAGARHTTQLAVIVHAAAGKRARR
jgi:PKD repeat protein